MKNRPFAFNHSKRQVSHPMSGRAFEKTVFMLQAARGRDRPIDRRTAVLTASMCACFALVPAAAHAAGLSAVYGVVKPSVVYVVSLIGDGTESGSGFIYASGDATSMIVTANHVVEGASKVDVILDSDAKNRYTATVVKRDHVRDIAELSIPVGHRIALKLAPAADITEGMAVAAIGYPRAAKKFERSLGDILRPSVHAGIVSAVRFDGEVLQFDATTDYGDSGGPVIDVASGGVVGIVRGGLLDQSYLSAGLETLPGSNIAMSANSIAAVLADAPLSTSKIGAASAGVASFFATIPLTSSPKHPTISPHAAAGAGSSGPAAPTGSTGNSSSAQYRVGFTVPLTDAPSGNAADATLLTKVVEHYKAIDDFYVIAVRTGVAEEPRSALSGYCDDNRLNAIIEPLARVRNHDAANKGAARSREADVSLELKVMDCSREPLFSGTRTSIQNIPRTSSRPSPQVTDELDRMLTGLMRDFDEFRKAHAGVWMDLLKTGIAFDSADDRYQSLFGFKSDGASKMYRVTTVYPRGPGDVAGIEVDDKIVSIDGKPTKGLTREALLTLLDAPKYTLAILRPGGTTMLQVEPKKHAALQSALSR